MKAGNDNLPAGLGVKKKEPAARHQQWVVDNMGKGCGKVGGQSVICQNKPVKGGKNSDNLPLCLCVKKTKQNQQPGISSRWLRMSARGTGRWEVI